jgi:hypothetical protein
MRGGRSDSLPLIGAAGALLAVGCCAGPPLLASVLGDLTIASVIGIGSGVLVAALVVSVLSLIRGRRRRASPSKEALR